MIFDKYVFIVLLVATCLMLFISYLSFRKRQLPVAKYCSLVMLTASFYSFGYAFEYISGGLDSIKFWLKIEYIGIPFISTFWFILVIHYTGHQAALSKRVMLLLFAIPAVTFVAHYTNDLHHFFYSDIRIDPNSVRVKAILDKGPWYWVHISYNYLQAAVGMVLFGMMYLKTMPVVRKQIMFLMLGTAAPWLSNVVYLFGLPNIEMDMTPLGFTLSGLFYLWGIYRFNMLRLVPVGLQTVFQTMEDGVIILDYDHNIINVNRAAREIFDASRSLNGLVFTVFTNYPELSAMIEDPGHLGGRITITKNEESRNYNVKISSLYDKGQTVLGKMLIFHDITEVITYQEKLLSNAEQLAEFSAFKDKLFTVVAHDIRDPLAMLVSATELLEEELEGDGGKDLKMYREVIGQVRNTYLLVEHLLEWFRSQRGKMVFNPRAWNLASSAEQAVYAAKTRSGQKDIEIISDIDHEITVFADKEMLDLVFRNLLSNAVKFTGKGGSIRIGAIEEGEWVIVSVEDSGVGVDEKIGKSLFHEVQQDHSYGTEGETGSGLGLYLSEKFVSIHGGRIWFQSIRGQGSTFFFTLPAYGAMNEIDVQGSRRHAG